MARRVVLLLLAVAFGALATGVSRQSGLAVPGALSWAARHPDPRALDAESARTVAGQLDGERRNDLVLLFAALAGGCVVVAAWPRAASWTGGVPSAVLLSASLGLGLFHLGLSAAGQLEGLRDGSWSVADDTLERLAPAQAATLREWVEQIGPDEAVILIGGDSSMYSAVVWALHPRPLYPVLLQIRPSTSPAEVLRGARALEVGREHAARWIVDLDVLGRGVEAGHPALMRIDP